MRHLKMLALAAVAAGALMAFIGAGTASATTLCSTTANPCPEAQQWPVGTSLDFSIPSGKQAVLVDTEGGELDKCSTSTVKGKLSTSNTGPVEELTWGSCTFGTKTLKAGKLEVQSKSGSSNGTVVAGATFEVTINVIFTTCVFIITVGVDLGEITEGNPAVFHANAVAEEGTSSSLCPNTAKWTSTYNLTGPSGTTLSVSS